MRNSEDWLKSYLEFCSYSEAPDTFHFWTGVSTIAGALRRKVYIDQGYFKWIPNFFVVLVARPGIVQKSTCSGIGMDLLKQVPGITFSPNSVTWQSLIETLAESTVGVPLKPGSGPLGPQKPMSAIMIHASEFGVFLKPENTEMIDVLVDLWDGKEESWEKKTKTMGGDKVENPCINIIAGTTPSWISNNFPEYMIHGGFASRTIFVFGDKKKQRIAYPKKFLPASFEKLRKELVEDLKQIASLVGEYTLTPEALSYGQTWYEEHVDALEQLDPDDRMASYLSRKQTQVHKLAMVLSAARRSDLTIGVDELRAAVEIISSNEAVLPQVFSKISSDTARGTSRLLELVQHAGRITQTEAYRKLMLHMSFQEFSEAVKGAYGSGKVKVGKDQSGKATLEWANAE